VVLFLYLLLTNPLEEHMMKKILFLFFILIGNYAQGQITFQKTYGGVNFESASSVIPTKDGGYAFAGKSYGDVYFVKTNYKGTLMWSKTFGGIDQDEGYDLMQTSDSCYIVTGITQSFPTSARNIYVIKMNVMGDTLWTRTYGGSGSNESGYSIQQTSDGGYIIGGLTYNYGAGFGDCYIIKIKSNGDVEWAKTYGGTDNDYAYYVCQTSDGGYAIIGRTKSFGAGDYDIYLIKTDNLGNLMWSKTYGGISVEYCRFIEQTADNGYIILGITQSFNVNQSDVYAIRTDSAGNIIWSKAYGGFTYDYGNFVQQTTDGGFIIAGSTFSFGNGLDDVYLIKTTANGDTLWTRAYGSNDQESGGKIYQTLDKGYIIAGCSFSFGDIDAYLIKTDSSGNSGCNQSNTATEITSPTTIVTQPLTLVSSAFIFSNKIPTTVGLLDSSHTLCSFIDIKEIGEIYFDFIMYPNPAHNTFTISFNGQSSMVDGQLTIFDVMGIIVHQQIITSAHQQIENSFSPGIYFVRVQAGEKEFTEKLVID
jgi:hypothetical protein